MRVLCMYVCSSIVLPNFFLQTILLKIRQFNSQKCYNKSLSNTQIEIYAHLNDPVLRWPSALSLEHGINICRHGHRDGLGAFLAHVPLFGVLMDFVMIKPAKWDIGAENDFCTIVLRKGNVG